MPHRITSLLIAHHEICQVNATLRAETAANAVEREIGTIEHELADLIRGDYWNGWTVYPLIRRLLHSLPERIAKRLQGHLAKTASWSARQAAGIMKKSLPTDYLRAVAARKLTHARSKHFRFESLRSVPYHFRSGDTDNDVLLEDTSTPSTGLLQLALNALGLQPTDYADPFREPARNEMTDEQQRQIFARLLFPAPPEDWVQRVLGLTLQHQTWYQTLNGSIRAAEFGPDRIAGAIGNLYAQGKTQGEIVDEIKPMLDGVKWRAARVARTYGLAVAGKAQEEMHKQADHLIIGWMVRSVMDERVRPRHRLRNGTVYFKEPKGGLPGLDQMPHPPLESDGSLAWNRLPVHARSSARTPVLGERRSQDGGFPHQCRESRSRPSCLLRMVSSS